MINNLIYKVAILFIMMIPGIIMKKFRLSTDGLGKGISNLVLYIAQPALIFIAYLRDFDKTVLLNSLWVFLFSFVAHGIFTVGAYMFFKKAEDGKRRMLRFATIFSNAAFMGIPLIDAVLGGEATLYASIYNITFNLFLWSLGVFICTEGRAAESTEDGDCSSKGGKISILKALLHPVTVAAALGLVFFITPLNEYIPTLVTESLEMLKNLVAPLSMIVIGLRLADLDLHGFFKDRSLYIFVSLRHIVLPLAVAAVMRLLLLCGVLISTDVIKVVIILACTPAASSATMFAERYDCDAAYVSKLVATSTVLSLITMPLVIYIATIGI